MDDTRIALAKEILRIKLANPSWGSRKIARQLNLNHSSVERTYERLLVVKFDPSRFDEALQSKKAGPSASEPAAKVLEVAPSGVSEADFETKAIYAKEFLTKRAMTRETLALRLQVSLQDVDKIIDIVSAKSDLTFSGGLLSLTPPERGRLTLDIYGGTWNRIGLVSDTHLCCKEQRLAELHAQYDLFVKEGITKVFHAGNLVDGFIERINGESALCITPTDQTQYVIDHYPAREGITTYFITGDDHEGWWKTINWGRDTEREASNQGRSDLVYLGHVEADVEFRTPEGGKCICKIQHPGGGSAYARSYTGQKQVEAFEGGEKPHILIQGHYHVSNYMNDRGVHVVSMPGFQDQTIFSRKKRLRMEVGGAIAEFCLMSDGSIGRFRLEWNRYFTRTFYRPYLKSDAKCLKGHLIIDATS